jgi:hypothetical protein
MNMNDTISKLAVIQIIEKMRARIGHNLERSVGRAMIEILDDVGRDVDRLPSALGTNLAEVGTDLISRQDALEAFGLSEKTRKYGGDHSGYATMMMYEIQDTIENLPPIQPKKEIAKRVLWTGWKGCRDTRYKCPNCKKPVKNDDIYCHRCGQKLMFPHISFTDYVPGEKQETIVRWDDE